MDKILGFDIKSIDKAKCIITHNKAMCNLNICYEANKYWDKELEQKDLDVDKFFEHFIQFDIPGFLLTHFKLKHMLQMSHREFYKVNHNCEYHWFYNNILVNEDLHIRLGKINEDAPDKKDRVFVKRCLKALIMFVGTER